MGDVHYLAKRGLLGLEALDTAHQNPTKLEEMFAPVQAGDEKKYGNTLRNFAVDKLGLPESFKETVADEKQWRQNAPEMMGSTMGAVKKVNPDILERAAMKVYPEFSQYISNMAKDPKSMVVLEGKTNSSFQKLRDLLGHTGPVKFK